MKTASKQLVKKPLKFLLQFKLKFLHISATERYDNPPFAFIVQQYSSKYRSMCTGILSRGIDFKSFCVCQSNNYM